MKNLRLKYGMLLLLFLVLNFLALKIYTPIKTIEKEPNVSYIISEYQASQNFIHLLHCIYSNAQHEGTTVDNQPYDLKYACKSLTYNDSKDKIQSLILSDKLHYHSYLHPDTIGYYIYALEKIVI